MSNDLTTNGNRVPATINNGHDPFLDYANSVRAEYTIGKLLKFAKGDYTAGEADEIIPHGTKLIAAVDLLTLGHVKWLGGKPAEHRMILVASGEKPEPRSELGDHDEALWELDDAGKPRDPWQLTQYLPMMAEDQELFTLTTSSRGGIGALATLARAYARRRVAHPGQFPVIELGVDAYQHSNSTYGRIKVPTLKVIGWEPKATFLKAAGMDGPEPIDQDFDRDPRPLAPALTDAAEIDEINRRITDVLNEDAEQR
jgi:hypothetical protein